jgi:glycosyltransferase involved in cell wall biosynthesis
MTLNISVIIPVYNAIRDLELVLLGFLRQSSAGFELIIADDGSGPEIHALVQGFARRSQVAIRHVYQSDEGFRKNRILNQAVKASAASYCIFSDGDCVPHRHFVQAHWEHRARRTVLCGRRVMLSKQWSERLTPQEIVSGNYERLNLWKMWDALRGRNRHLDEGILLSSRFLRTMVNRRSPTLLGCNFSLEKSVIEEVNGFNEDFVSYGGADTEFECRLRLGGIRFKWIRHLGIQYHLFHAPRLINRDNVAIIERIKEEGRPACHRGLQELSGAHQRAPEHRAD